MLNQVVSAVAAIDYGGAFSPERLVLAGQMTLIGMAMIFAVLTALMLVLMVFKQIFAKDQKTAKEKPVKETSAVANVIAESAQVMNAAPAITQNDELIAVITAAVAAYRAEEGESTDGFRVVSFRRSNSPRAWNANK